MNCKKANQIDIISHLKKGGFHPIKESGNNVWFLSPFRYEKTPSFKVNAAKNVWYDFAEGIGGKLIDLVMILNKCNIKEALKILSNGSFLFHKQEELKIELNYEIIKTVPIENSNLISYLKSRKINFNLALKFCYQIHYSFNKNKVFYAIGFMNDSGGFEIRNKFFKGCLGKKNITTIINGFNTVSIFESWSDLLSYLTLKIKIPNEDFIILNSTALVKKTISTINNYELINCFLDNDDAGKKALNYIIKNSDKRIINKSIHYANYNDLNDYLINGKNEQV